MFLFSGFFIRGTERTVNLTIITTTTIFTVIKNATSTTITTTASTTTSITTVFKNTTLTTASTSTTTITTTSQELTFQHIGFGFTTYHYSNML
jgi:hypothetical protein